jgi:YggT family protein
MRLIFNFLAIITSLYLLLIFIKIILSWFGNTISGKPVELINRATDPYLDFWRGRLNLRIGNLDMSPIAAIAGLSILQNLFSTLARYGKISIGNILAVVLWSVWSAVSFIIGFCLVIVILRLIGYLISANIYSPFWGIINTISEPILYRINRIIFGKRIIGFLRGIIISALALIVIWIGGAVIINIAVNILSRLPV